MANAPELDGEERALLHANGVFYDAFASRDIEGMDELWAKELPVACIHPGWPPLYGREEVMSSWRQILLGGAAPEVQCEQPQASIVGDTGYIICIERIGHDALVATNWFARQNGLWQLVHHQAGPLRPDADTPPPDTRLN